MDNCASLLLSSISQNCMLSNTAASFRLYVHTAQTKLVSKYF